MRVLIVALLLAPLSGCLGGLGLIESDLFDYIEVERGESLDPQGHYFCLFRRICG